MQPTQHSMEFCSTGGKRKKLKKKLVKVCSCVIAIQFLLFGCSTSAESASIQEESAHHGMEMDEHNRIKMGVANKGA